jgi:hypothetical protein
MGGFLGGAPFASLDVTPGVLLAVVQEKLLTDLKLKVNKKEEKNEETT